MNKQKKKILVIALAVCLLATVSFSTLAWFNAQADVTNTFKFATSGESGNEKVDFDVTVEEKEEAGDDWTDEGLEYEHLLPGDKLGKIVKVSNSGDYDEWVRVNIVFSDYTILKNICAMEDSSVNFPTYALTKLLDINRDVLLKKANTNKLQYEFVEDTTNDTATIALYINSVVVPDASFTVMNGVNIPTQFDQNDLIDDDGNVLGGDGFTITVVADAIQVQNLGAENAYDAFNNKVNWPVGSVNPTV